MIPLGKATVHHARRIDHCDDQRRCATSASHVPGRASSEAYEQGRIRYENGEAFPTMPTHEMVLSGAPPPWTMLPDWYPTVSNVHEGGQ